MASSENDHDDGNETREEESCFVALFKKRKTTKKKDEDETKDTPTTEGVQSHVPEVQPKPQRTTFQKNEEALDTAITDQNQHDSAQSRMPEMQPKKQRTTFQKNEEALLDTATTDQNQQDSKVPTWPKPKPRNTSSKKNKKPSNIAATEQHQCIAENRITSSLSDRQNEKYKPNNHKKIIKEDMGDGIEFGGNVKSPVKQTDNKNKPLQQRHISNMNEAYKLGKDVNVTQQTQQKNVVTDNQQQNISNAGSRVELGQVNIGACMNEEIHTMQQLENTNLNKECEHLIKEIKSQRKTNEDIKNESEDIINQVLHENENLTREIERIKRENNDCVANDNHPLQQNNISMESVLFIHFQLLEEKSHEIFELQLENSKLKSEILPVKEENIDLANEIHLLQRENMSMKTDINVKVNQLEEKSNKVHKLEQQSINIQNEMQGLREENNNLNGELLRVKQEINDCAKEIHELQQQNTNMESDMTIKVSQLEEKSNEVYKLQEEMQGVRDENSNLKSEILQLQREKTDMSDKITRLEQKLITDSGSVVNLGIELGRGAYGTVFKGEFYGTEVAVKEYHEFILSPYNMKNLRREINIASHCRHPNLLQFICATKNDKNRLLIVTELMDTTLRTLLGQRANEMSKLEPQEIKSISLDVARGLNYLHSQKPDPIIHRDISSANVLLWLENNSVKRAKISDYGAANFMEMCNTSNPGGILYAAPEATGAKHGPKIDVYSFGVLLCEMSTCEQPIPEERASQINGISNANLKELAGVCTSTDSTTRPTMQKIIVFMSTINM